MECTVCTRWSFVEPVPEDIAVCHMTLGLVAIAHSNRSLYLESLCVGGGLTNLDNMATNISIIVLVHSFLQWKCTAI